MVSGAITGLTKQPRLERRSDGSGSEGSGEGRRSRAL